jgi:hypothetical protein
MDYPITFHFRGQAYTAKAHLSLQEDGCYIFTFLDDPDLIDEFGPDVDIATDCQQVLPDLVTNDNLTALKVAILEVVKALPAFGEQKPKKLIIRREQLN